MRLAATLCFYNELETGHLHRWIDWIKPLVDDIYAWDDGSTDGSGSFLASKGATVIGSPDNCFVDELKHHSAVLDLARDADWILCFDADEAIEPRLQDRQALESFLAEVSGDALSLKLWNLWGDEATVRQDGNFYGQHFVRLVRPSALRAPGSSGLHSKAKLFGPATKVAVCFLHYGFMTEEMRQEKLRRYRMAGQVENGKNWYTKHENAQLVPLDTVL